ncbi:hypothetical protein [Spirosoma rhododendri]|uniref:DUF2281 domain-containing protein n=1 Tax=Spirosoma rhododendri TaxID=2728024 RepID=A0A7L5DQI4_9BACT|nr:hypothetical protein [Spirosoma rhododendri]QJD80689.1 hypothetical protein HH216_21405 [Spirosoma rhododendri]
MTKQAIIDRTVKAISQLPDDKAAEISDFVEFISKRYEEQQLTAGLQTAMAESQAFSFLQDDDDIYSVDDLKVPHNE